MLLLKFEVSLPFVSGYGSILQVHLGSFQQQNKFAV